MEPRMSYCYSPDDEYVECGQDVPSNTRGLCLFWCFRSYDNTNFHHRVEQGLSVKITCCGVSKSMNGQHNFNKMSNETPKKIPVSVIIATCAKTIACLFVFKVI